MQRHDGALGAEAPVIPVDVSRRSMPASLKQTVLIFWNLLTRGLRNGSFRARKRSCLVKTCSGGEVDSTVNLELELLIALEREQFSLFAQPQWCPVQTLIGYEILLRWVHPERGLLLPDDFLPVAEQTGLIHRIERYVVKKAFKEMAVFLKDNPHLTISINLSPSHVEELDFERFLHSVFVEFEIDPKSIIFELTERVKIIDLESFIAKMMRISQWGCQFSMDDFGTGYSWLSRLRRLPIVELKVDREFIIDAPTSIRTAAIIQTVIKLGESLNLRLIAEGISSERHLQFIQENHPNVNLQGFFLGKPRPLSEILAGR